MPTEWYDIKFLESATNVRQAIFRSQGRKPSASKAQEVAVCLQQGRLFFEAASAAALSIRPLLIYYGVLAFSRGLVVALLDRSLSAQTRGHGISDITPSSKGLEDLILRCDDRGTFYEFDEAIASLGRVWFYENSMPRWFDKSFDSVTRLRIKHISIIDILSRLPGLSREFEQTFGTPSKALLIQLNLGDPATTRCELRIDDPALYTDRAGLAAIVQRLRRDFNFLESWRFLEASHAWNKSVLLFDNSSRLGHDDVADSNLVPANNNGFVSAYSRIADSSPMNRFIDILPPLSGGYTNTHTYAMQPLQGANVSEHSLQFMGTFLLSSFVRYSPQSWQRTISRSTVGQRPADDRALPLIEEFLDDVLRTYPRMVVRVIDYLRAD